MITLNNGKRIGKGVSPYIIIEVNTSHFGDIEKAKRMAEIIKSAGADCIKFQSWSEDSLYSEEYYKNNPIAKRFIKKFSLSPVELKQISDYCKSIGLDFSSTPYSKEEATFLVNECQAPFIKVASMDINNLDYLKYIATLGSAIIISTGMANYDEIYQAVDVLQKSGAKDLVVFHCVSVYPAPTEIINLENIKTLSRNLPDCVIGYSDHTLDVEIGAASVAMGAQVIEKHFTLDSSVIGMDNQMAIEEDDLKRLVKYVRNISKALGSEERTLSEIEKNQRTEMRRSLVYSKNFNIGHVLKYGDLEGKRPGNGIAIDKLEDYLGRKLSKEVREGYLIKDKDFE